ncbi:MAG: GNAT family N-acetyltransferase [Acidimicrobiia bacterium]
MSAHLVLRRHVDAVADALTDAFLDDPVMVWLAGHPDPLLRAATLRAAMFAPAAAAVLRTGWGLAVPGSDGTVAGAALWNPPGTSFFADEDRGAIADGLAGAAEGAGGRLRALVLAMHERHFPTEECFHLQFIGVTAAARSRGLGVQLVAPVLERCDADGLPAALESSNPRNVSFYRRLGFEVLWEIRPEGGPPLQAMWRPPRGSR